MCHQVNSKFTFFAMVEHKFLIHYSAVTYIGFSNYLACLCMTLDLTILLTACIFAWSLLA